MREKYLVTLNRDPRVTRREMEHYIRSACAQWSGQLEGEDPLRNHGKPTVKRIKT